MQPLERLTIRGDGLNLAADAAGPAGAHHMVAGDANGAFNDAVFGFTAKQSAMRAGS
jgi:hypothetical protein